MLLPSKTLSLNILLGRKTLRKKENLKRVNSSNSTYLNRTSSTVKNIKVGTLSLKPSSSLSFLKKSSYCSRRQESTSLNTRIFENMYLNFQKKKTSAAFSFFVG